MSSAFNAFAMAQSQLDGAARRLELDEATVHLLREPTAEHRVALPVRMDDGSVRIFRGFRVVHNDARGAAKGGVRFHPVGGLDVVRASAMWSTWKAALTEIPLGGSAGGVACDLHGLSEREQERLARAFVRALARELGPDIDILEPGLQASPRHMLWMLDELEVVGRGRRSAAVVGKPPGIGGSRGRPEAHGYGVVFVVREALRTLGVRPENARVAIQGFGGVGRHAARLLHRLGARIVCVTSWSHARQAPIAFVRREGIDPDELGTVTGPLGGIDADGARRLGYEVGDGDTWVEQAADVLIPAALENQITPELVSRVNPAVKIVAEGADGATAPAAEEALVGRGVEVIPDLLAGAGSAVCGYFEQVQALSNAYWQEDEVFARLDLVLTAAYEAVRELASRRSMGLREAALVIAVSRVAETCRERGWV